MYSVILPCVFVTVEIVGIVVFPDIKLIVFKVSRTTKTIWWFLQEVDMILPQAFAEMKCADEQIRKICHLSKL